MIENHLAQANRHIAEGKARIAGQEALAARWASNERNTATAREILEAMHKTLALMHEHRAVLLSEREQAIQSLPPPHKP